MSGFSINFDKLSKSYTSGDTITGVVNITSASGREIKCLRMKFIGYEKMGLMMRHIIFSHTSFLVDPNQQGRFLQAGCNSFPFQFTLPPKLPSSFKYPIYGKIAYSVQARIIKASGFKEQATEYFTVCASLNLGPTIAGSTQPLVRMNTQALSSSKFVNATLVIPKTGFIPGECVPMQVQIENMSHCTCYGFVIVLQRAIMFHTGWMSQHESETLATQDGLLRVLPYSTETLNINEFLIPLDLPPSSLSYSRYLRIKYDIGLVIKIKGGKTMCLSVPIIVGSHYGAPEEATPA